MGQITFENYDRRIHQILTFLEKNGLASLEEADSVCRNAGLDVAGTVRGIQPICFQDAPWAYVVGAAAALKRGDPSPGAVAATLGEGLQSFCLPGSVSAQREIGLGHGKLAAMVLSDDVRCFAFLAGHPRAARIVGALMHTAPSDLPCHRVLYKDGSLCPGEVFGGPARQREMLESEGISFLSDGRADMKQHLWHPIFEAE